MSKKKQSSLVRAVGYFRVSTSGQVQHGESLNTQRKQIEDFIKLKGWQPTGMYADEGISGETDGRLRL